MLDVICLRQVEGEAVACVDTATVAHVFWVVLYVFAAIGLLLLIIALAWDGKEDEERT